MVWWLRRLWAASLSHPPHSATTASTFATITSPHTSMLNVGTAQAQADTPRPNTNEPNA
jgi:hypothetical protein